MHFFFPRDSTVLFLIFFTSTHPITSKSQCNYCQWGAHSCLLQHLFRYLHLCQHHQHRVDDWNTTCWVLVRSILINFFYLEVPVRCILVIRDKYVRYKNRRYTRPCTLYFYRLIVVIMTDNYNETIGLRKRFVRIELGIDPRSKVGVS